MKNNYEMFKVEIKKGKRADTIDSKFEFNHVYENLAKVDALESSLWTHKERASIAEEEGLALLTDSNKV